MKQEGLDEDSEADAEKLDAIESFPQLRPAHFVPSPVTDLDMEMETDGISRPPSLATTPCPSDQGTLAPARPTNDDDDMWDILNNLDGQPAPPSGLSLVKQPMAEPSSRPPDEDDEMWDIAEEMGIMGGGPYGPLPSAHAREKIQKPAAVAGSSDAIVNGNTSQVDNSAAVSRKKPTNDEDWDDMYL